MKYRTQPVTIDAYQPDVELDIPTLEGTMHASIGDYIITGVRGEQYPCKPDLFVETYEPFVETCEPAYEPDYDAGYRDGSIHYELDHCPACKNVADLQEALAENAKLRKLCKTLYQLADESYVPFGSANRWMDDFAKAICAMRELGIEVDG